MIKKRSAGMVCDSEIWGCGNKIDSSSVVQWFGGKAVPEVWYNNEGGSDMGWRLSIDYDEAFDLNIASVEDVIDGMVKVEEPGVVTREMEDLEPVDRGERVWKRSDLNVVGSESVGLCFK